MTEFLEKFDGYTRQFERVLEKYCAEMNYRPAVLAESILCRAAANDCVPRCSFLR